MSCGIDYEKAAHDRFWWLNKTGGTAHDNMTVLDYFAAQAMVELIGWHGKGGRTIDEKGLAADSYTLAAAMMNERTKQESSND